MGIGGYLNLINGSPYPWTLTGTHSYQMQAWNWPQTVQPGVLTPVYVEWGTGRGMNMKDDAGEVYYSIEGTPDKFSIHFKNINGLPTGFQVQAILDNMETQNNPRGSKIDIGFEHDRARNFILSGKRGQYSSSNPPSDWMHDNLDTLGGRKLRHICMPGTHNSGMSVLRDSTFGSIAHNTVTQLLNMHDQLEAGARFFDIRPILHKGKFYTGHYSEAVELWLGGNGQPIDEIIDEINRYTAKNHELVILALSHAYNTGNDSLTDHTRFTQAEWNRLFEQLKRINNRLINFVNRNDQDLTQRPLRDFIKPDKGAVLIFIDAPSQDVDPAITPGDYLKEGIFSSKNFPYYNNYAGTDDVIRMRDDQMRKLRDNRNVVKDGKDGFFLLSWTLTLKPHENILRSTTRTYYPLFDAFNAFRPEIFPNVLYVDAFGMQYPQIVNLPGDTVPFPPRRTRDITALAMAINNGMASRNKYITG